MRVKTDFEMNRFAVIDTETTWGDAVMSIGIAIGGTANYELLDTRYYILTPFKNHGGMYRHALYANRIKPDLECSRERALDAITSFLDDHNVSAIFAYNAGFDYRHLPELAHMDWRDIMQVAAYRQHNSQIPKCAECYKTGRLKRGYGVENIYRLLSGDQAYCELHNALADAVDELSIMKMLGHGIEKYERL